MGNMSFTQAGTHVLTYGSHDHDDEEEEEDGEEKSLRRRGDPCFHYTVLDQAWRATNTTSKFKMCDRQVKWKGRSSSLHGFIRELIQYNSANFRNEEKIRISV